MGYLVLMKNRAADPAVVGKPTPPIRQLLVFGVYEGISATKDDGGRNEVKVSLGTLKTPTTLVVGNHEALSWSVSANNPELIERVILGGFGAEKSVVTVNRVLFPSTVVNKKIPYAYEKRGMKFRQIVEQLPATLGFDTVTSFTGSYTAPDEGFKYEQPLKQDASLKVRYLDDLLVPDSELPAINYASTIDGISGIYDLRGHFLEKKEMALPSTQIDGSGSKFKLRSDGIEITNSSNATKQFVKVDNSSISLLQPKLLVYNSEKNTLTGFWKNNWADSYLDQYSLDHNRWEKFSSLDRIELYGAKYNTLQNKIFVSYYDNLSRKIGLGYLAEDGSLVRTDEFYAKDILGFSDLWDMGNSVEATLHIAAAQDEWIVLTAGFQTSQIPKSDAIDNADRIYLYNTKTKKIELTAYSNLSNGTLLPFQ